MNCLHITLFFHKIAGIIQSFIVLEPASVSPSHRIHHDLFLHLIIVVEFLPARCFFLRPILPFRKVTINSNNLFVNYRWTFTFGVEK